MEVKNWSYDEFPEFTDIPDGAEVLSATGEEIAVRCLHDVEYARVNGTPLHLEILLPMSRSEYVTGTRKIRPCIMFVQGSAWLEQDLYNQIPMVSKLAERGYVVAIVEYRHSGIEKFPAPITDARNAVRFMRIHAGEYGINPENIIMSGDSSGGHTAVYAGIMHDDESKDNMYPNISAEVKGIINLYGSVSVMAEDANPTTVNHCLPDSPEGMEMGNVNLRENVELRKLISIEENITSETEIAPMLIFHGTKDRTVNVSGNVMLYRKLKECGKDVRFYLVQGADHGGAEFWMPQTLDIMEKFIKYCIDKPIHSKNI